MTGVGVPTGTLVTWDEISARIAKNATVTAEHTSVTTTYVVWLKE
jgi:hypothetical protein